MDEITYFEDQQRNQDYDGIKQALIKLNQGRNKDCWPLVSFGWKDADLEPWGCTGIKRVVRLDDYSVVVEVGGHKTFCPRDEYNPSDDEQEYIFNVGYSGYWSGDDWSVYLEPIEVSVEWILNEFTGEPDYNKTAEVVITKSRKAVEEFERAMEESSKDWDNL